MRQAAETTYRTDPDLGGENPIASFVKRTDSTPLHALPNADHLAANGRTAGRESSIIDGPITRFTDPGSDDEYEQYIISQGRLAHKKMVSGLTHREGLDLQLIRWAIDRIEAARMNECLGGLEKIAAMQERLAEEIKSFVENVKSL